MIERSRRRESSVEEEMIEMYLAGISVRRMKGGKAKRSGARASGSRAIYSLDEKNVRQDRGLAGPAHRRGASLSLFGRHRDEAGWPAR